MSKDKKGQERKWKETGSQIGATLVRGKSPWRVLKQSDDRTSLKKKKKKSLCLLSEERPRGNQGRGEVPSKETTAGPV